MFFARASELVANSARKLREKLRNIPSFYGFFVFAVLGAVALKNQEQLQPKKSNIPAAILWKRANDKVLYIVHHSLSEIIFCRTILYTCMLWIYSLTISISYLLIEFHYHIFHPNYHSAYFVQYPLVNKHCYGKSTLLMGKPTISMAMFNNPLVVLTYQRVNPIKHTCFIQ